MRKIIIGLLAVGFVSAGAWMGCSQAADEAAPAATPPRPRQHRRGEPRGARQPGGAAAAPAAGCKAAAARRRRLRPCVTRPRPSVNSVASTPKGS